MRFYNNRLLAINLCRLSLGGQTVKNLRLLASKFELDQSQHKSTQVVASRRKEVQNLRRLASPFGQGLREAQCKGSVYQWDTVLIHVHV